MYFKFWISSQEIIKHKAFSTTNIQYLASYLRMLNAQIEDLKNRSARGSREKITQLNRLRDWMERKLEEEKADRLYFESKLKKV